MLIAPFTNEHVFALAIKRKCYDYFTTINTGNIFYNTSTISGSPCVLHATRLPF
jgi:hypothetical protein